MVSKLHFGRHCSNTKIHHVEVGEHISPSASRFGESVKILFRWRGSIYKLLWQPVLLYFGLYMLLTIVYDFGLSEAGRKEFEAIALYCSRYTSSIPVILLLGFFTSTAMQRWFTTQTSIPGTARAITVFTMSLKESTPDGEQIVLQYSRWLLLSWVLALRMICSPLKNHFPDLISLQSAGLLLDHERIILEEEEMNGGRECLPLTVLDWIFHLLKRINRQGNFNAANDYARNVDAVLTFKKSCGNTLKFASKNIPFALIQAVAITVYAFGLASLMSRQFVDRHQSSIILNGYLPILHSIQYFLYFAWLKFGQMAANPFGEDEDDIDMIKLFRNHVEDANRLRGLFTSQNMDDLITASIENSATKLMENGFYQLANDSQEESEQPTSTFTQNNNMVDVTTPL